MSWDRHVCRRCGRDFVVLGATPAVLQTASDLYRRHLTGKWCIGCYLAVAHQRPR